MQYQALQIVDSPELINNCYKTLHRVIEHTSPQRNRLIKQQGWIAVCAHENLRGDTSKILKAIQEDGYTEFTAASWQLLEPIVMQVQATPQGMNEFFMNNIDWCIIFTGRPDWMIVFANPLDFWLVLGQPSFVEKVLGCSPDEAFMSVEEMVNKSRFLTDLGREQLSYLLNQLREFYPVAQVGDEIEFEFT